MRYVDVATTEPSPITKNDEVVAVDETTPDPLFSNTPAVVKEDRVGTDENVCVPVNVCAASVLASVALVVGNVIWVLFVPVNDRMLNNVRRVPELKLNPL